MEEQGAAGVGNLPLTTWVAIRRIEIADPCILGNPFLVCAAQSAVVAIMKLSADWHDFRAKLDKLYPRVGKPTQLAL